MPIPDDSRRATQRARATADATAKALVDFPSPLTLDFSQIKIADLTAAKRRLEIQEEYCPSSSLEVPIVAAESIPAYAPVTSQGKRADSGDPSSGMGRIVGLAVAAIAPGFSGMIVAGGEITNPAWSWTKGAHIFLNGNGISNCAPNSGFVQQIGTAVEPTKLVVDLASPVLL